jgi:hypothetical protein
MTMKNNQQLLDDELDNLPTHYRETFSYNFLILLAALRLHGFSIQRADEAVPVIAADKDLWPELSHPSVWLSSMSAPTNELQKAEPGSPAHTIYTNQVIRAHLTEQRRLLELLEAFYAMHVPASFYARLIAETVDIGETYLRSQGASVRITLEDEQLQTQWLEQSQLEMTAFSLFLVNKLPLKAQ